MKSLGRLVKHDVSFLKNLRTRLSKRRKQKLVKRKQKLRQRRARVMLNRYIMKPAQFVKKGERLSAATHAQPSIT